MQPSLGMGSGFKSFNLDGRNTFSLIGFIKIQVLPPGLFHIDPLQLHEQNEHSCSFPRHIVYQANDHDFSYSPLRPVKRSSAKISPVLAVFNRGDSALNVTALWFIETPASCKPSR